MSAANVPKVALVQKPVDGGVELIGIIECPHCGQTHYTHQLGTGTRMIYCGKTEDGRNIVQRVNVAVVL